MTQSPLNTLPFLIASDVSGMIGTGRSRMQLNERYGAWECTWHGLGPRGGWSRMVLFDRTYEASPVERSRLPANVKTAHEYAIEIAGKWKARFGERKFI